MTILLLTLAYSRVYGNKNLYTDLMEEFSSQGHTVFVLCPLEKRESGLLSMEVNNVHIYRVPTGNITKARLFEKAVSTLKIESQFVKAFRKHLFNTHIDLLLYSTPPITFGRAVKSIKNKNRCLSYLLLKDIFPQNAVDMGLIKKHEPLHAYFRRKEQGLYRMSDIIGCMSPGNKKYLLEHNRYLDGKMVTVTPNAIKPSDSDVSRESIEISKDRLKQIFGIPKKRVTLLYGGNLGKPQGIDFILEFLSCIAQSEKIFVLIVGSGTEYARLEKFSKRFNDPAFKVIPSMVKDEYIKIMTGIDIGLVFLDKRFTIPNIPSRLLDFWDHSKPILAATDRNTDLKDIIREKHCGLWSESGNIAKLMVNIDILVNDPALRIKMGHNGRELLEAEYTVERSVEKIIGDLERFITS